MNIVILILSIIALIMAGVALNFASDCQDDTDEHNEMLANLKRKLREKGIIE